MPGIGGLETLKRIKEFDKNIVVIVVTAFGSVETEKKARDLGASAFFSKPFEIPILLSRVKESLASKC